MTVVDLFPGQHTTPATLTDYQRFRYVFEAPKTVPCDYCHKPAEWDCTSSGGYVVGFHAARIKAVKHLTDEEKVAAVAAMMAAQSRRRAKLDEVARQRAADPVYQAELKRSHDWWNAQFARIREESAAEERDFRERCTDNPIVSSEWSRSHADGCRCRLDGEVKLKPRPKVLPVGELPVTDLADRRGQRRRGRTGGAA